MAEKTGRIIYVWADDLRVGDEFAGDSTVVTEVHIVTMDNRKHVLVIGICHGIEKRAIFKVGQEVRLWQTIS